jgi:hypothetical protein
MDDLETRIGRALDCVHDFERAQLPKVASPLQGWAFSIWITQGVALGWLAAGLWP